MENLSEIELFQRIQMSDYPAFNELYKRNWKALFSMAHKKTGSKDDAFDLVQDVFMEFYDKRERVIVNIPVKDYLRNALIFKLSTYFRTLGFQNKHYKNFELFMQGNYGSAAGISDLDVEEAELEYQEMVSILYKSIEDLPEKMKEIFIMSRTGNYSIVEIAEKFDLSPQTVKNQISKALLKVRQNTAHQHVTSAHLALIIWLIF